MRVKFCLVLATVFLVTVGFLPAKKQKNTNVQFVYGDEFFKSGQFNTARKIFKSVLKDDKDNVLARVRLGYIDLLFNRLQEAEKYLSEALKLKPGESFPSMLLAEVLYRQDKMVESGAVYESLMRPDIAQKLKSFGGMAPYFFSSGPSETVVPFQATDPLPLVKVRLNDGEDVYFIIDTGSSELIVNRSLAESTGMMMFESIREDKEEEESLPYGHGRLDRLIIGDWEIKNLPVHTMDMGPYSSLGGGRRVDGILGTVFFYHFLTTLDYPGNRLVLRRKTAENLQKMEKETARSGRVIAPFLLAGDHFILAWGSVNKSEPIMFFVDTGLAGGGFACPPSTVQEAGISLSNPEDVGKARGGKRFIKVRVEKVALGDAVRENVLCLYDIFPRALENMFGFRVGGLVSHDFFRPYSVTFDFDGMRIILVEEKT
ncbi:MAG: aspartyl protease family protein [Candidatus Aminicenantes bacterium]|nr:aspartyl protease family protein [Candidatus Aminicenantes bacterium]